MAELLLRVLARAGQTIHNPFSMGRSYIKPRPGEINRDFQKVAKDMSSIGKDMKKTAQRELQGHGQ